MTDLLICGINGRMGKEVYRLACEREDINVVCGVDRHALGDFNCPVYTEVKQACGHIDAIIDFSSPSSLDGLLQLAEENECSLVLATTGYTDDQLEKIQKASTKLRIWLSPNASTGINAILRILPSLKSSLPNFDCAVSEFHRKKKKDKPSGTAIALQNTLGECEVVSLRGGDVRGVHQITFMGEHEMITVTHTVFSRKAFAEGALNACLKLNELPSGLYC